MNDISLTSFKIKGEKTQITNMRNKKVGITKNPTDVKGLRKYYE